MRELPVMQKKFSIEQILAYLLFFGQLIFAFIMGYFWGIT